MRVRCWQNKGPVLLSEILPWCVREHAVDMLLLLSRASTDLKSYRFDPAIDKKALEILGPKLIRQFRASAWPGTQLFKNRDRVYVARFDAKLMHTLIAIEDSLFNWRHWPNGLPEDICVFRKGADYPVLVSTTHEEDAFVLSNKARPRGFEKSDVRPAELIWPGPYFCRTSMPWRKS